MEDRKKKPRFSEKEIELLVQGVKERSDIINSKFSDVINNSKKKQAWVEVMEAVNAVSFTIRTVDELKKKWDDVKRGTKKRASAVHKERCKTGSGKLNIMPLSTMEEDIVSVMDEERIFGFISYVDTMIPLTPSKALSGESPSQDGQGVTLHTLSKALSGESPSQDGQDSQRVTLNTPKGFTECTSSGPTVTNFPHVNTQPQVLVLTSNLCTFLLGFELRTELSDLKILVTVTKKIKRQRPFQNEEHESLLLQRELIKIQREWLDVEKERLGIEREKLHIERRRLEMEERAWGVCTAYKQPEERRSLQIDHELFHGAFMQI